MTIGFAGLGGFKSVVRGAGLATVFLAAGLCLPAAAQQPAEGAKKEAAKTQQGSAWVKLCEDQKLKQGGNDKEAKTVNVCLTHHERFHPNTGQPLISAAIRELDDPKQRTVMIMVPLGRMLPAGLIMKVDEKEGVKLQYSYCTALGCVAEVPATDDIIGKLKKGSELIIGTVDISRRKIAFKVPLNGFTRALDGKPIDRKVYAEARKEMFKQIRARQEKLLEKAKAEAAAKKKAGGDAGQKKTQ